MKKILFLLFIASTLFGCRNDEPSDLHGYTNRWILKEMKKHYFWNDKIPHAKNLNIALEHKAFFQSILYRHKLPGGDRFSWIQPNYLELMQMLKGVTPMDAGFEYRPFRAEEKNKVVFLVLYIKKGSDAASKNLKRGDIIRTVNGESINVDNYGSILSNKNNLRLGVDGKGEIAINSMPHFAENPIFLSETLQPEGSNKKIAYLAYMFFSPDKGDKTNAYDLALFEEFEKFAAEDVDEFILDLRYNSGGALSSCRLLSSLLKKDRTEEEIFAILKSNKSINAQQQYKFIETYNGRPLPKLTKVNKLFIITGKRTASASEMVINGLRPYMQDVILIGDTTVGKNVGSYTLYDTTYTANKWGIQPITFKIFNSKEESDYSEGFIPKGDRLINEFDPKYSMVDLGKFQDPLLNRALKEMGITIPLRAEHPGRRKRNIERPTLILGEPLQKRPTKENWQESEMEYPMYIEKTL